VDSVHEAVDHAGLVHHGLAAIAACLSSSELGLRLLRWSGLPDEGRRRERGAQGLGSGLTGAWKAVERRRVSGQGGGGESFGVGRSGLGNGATRSGGGAVGRGNVRASFYRVRGGAGRSGIGGERAAAMVRHNVDGGGRFGRGSAGVVVVSDEGGCSGCCGSGRAPGGSACVHMRRRRWLSA
jgi:hypothetical protein